MECQTARSYLTIDEAGVLMNQLWGGDVWARTDEVHRQQALNTSTLHIDSLSNLCGGFIGEKSIINQPLEFPRTVTDNLIPDDVKRATAMEALFIISAADKISQINIAVKAGLKSKSVGHASESYASQAEISGKGMNKYLGSDDAIALMRKYLTFSGGGAFPVV